MQGKLGYVNYSRLPAYAEHIHAAAWLLDYMRKEPVKCRTCSVTSPRCLTTIDTVAALLTNMMCVKYVV